MSDNLDNDLKNRIREIFDNYEDETADAGWELLRQKFPAEEKKRRVIAWWWYSAAAVLLLCMGAWFFYPQRTQQGGIALNKAKRVSNGATANQQQQVAAGNSVSGGSTSANTDIPTSDEQKVATTLPKPADGVSADDSYNEQTTETAGTVNNLSGATLANTSKAGTRHMASGQRQNAEVNPLTMAYSKNSRNFAPKKPQRTITGSIADNSASAEEFAANSQNIAKTQSASVADSGYDNVVVKNNSTQQVASVVVQKPANQQSGDPVLNMIAADDARRQAAAKNATKKNEALKSNKETLLSVYAATYFNYAKGSESQVNVGAGFTSDFKLSNRFKLSTGLAIAQNKLNYNSDNNVPQQINAKALANSTASNSNMVSASFAYDGLSTLASNSPTVKNYNANLVGLDIPLNIKYQFNPEKSDTYILAGISSGTYINETYRSTISYSNYYRSANALAGAANTSQTQESSNTQHFGTFDFAKTLNLSFGIGYPVGKSNKLIVEPFLKYPLNGLGSQDIRFGASGVNLKLSFSGSKKK